jgi:predicted CXXCH cytochrome family protein
MKRPADHTAAWKWTGLAVAAFIVVSLPLYYFLGAERAGPAAVPSADARFVGSAECRDCHNPEFDAWEGSHHDLAMDVATEDTVLGDFDDAEFILHGVTSRFYRKDGRYFVHTNGPGGEMGDFEITHVFGWFPLQQYLVPFPGGRLQTLHIAWDSRDKQWFRVPPEGPVDPDDWLYWTNAAQNWNGMCAQCHSTNLQKNYDPESDSYDTTWSDIDVGCEACHGAGSRHVAWADMPEMARPQTENFDLEVLTRDLDSRELVELCAPCHSRRGSLGDTDHAEADLLDNYLPSLLTEDLYFADGQILDEVYVYGSFTQSKMYRNGVRCSDCHDVHSAELVDEGNKICLQCHRAEEYDAADHHFHKQEGEEGEPIRSAEGEVLFAVGTGAECVQCHMPGRYYMGNDYRPDHSFRIPDPSLSASVGAPDACLRCHVDQDSTWSQQAVIDWYGPGQRSHYGTILARGRNGDPDAGEDLSRLAGDAVYPVNVRATALSLLAAYPGRETLQAMEIGLLDEEALLRHTAVLNIDPPTPARLAELVSPLLYDPVKTVRIEAARRLAGDMARFVRPEHKGQFDLAMAELEQSMLYSADFASGRHNLANFYARLDRPEDAMRQYEEAIRIDDQFYPAKANLAVLYSQQGRNREAEQLLRSALQQQPDLHDMAYSLGLLLVEMQQYPEALAWLERAASGLPERARIHYNLGLLYQFLQDLPEAENSLRTALALEPGNPDYQIALADHYLKLGRFEEARPIAEQLMATYPENPVGRQMLEFIQSQVNGGSRR